MNAPIDPSAVRQRLMEGFATAVAAGKPKTARRLLESYWLWDGFGGSDLLDRVRPRSNDGDGVGLWLPPNVPSDRRHGSNWPLWRNQQELDLLRQQSRVLAASNSFAQGVLRSKVNSVIGKGYDYKVEVLDENGKPAAEDQLKDDGLALERITQSVVDRFLRLNHWNASINPTDTTALGGTRERDCYRTVNVDGDCFLRFHGQDDGTMLVRPIDASQVRDGGRYLPQEGWTYGIQHQMEPFEDVETPLQYAVFWPDTAAKGGEGASGKDFGAWEEIDAQDVLHLKGPDTPANVKRGLPLFVFDNAQALERASKLQRNASIGAAIRAAIAETTQHAQATQAQISSMAAALASRSATNSATGQTTPIEHIPPGTMRRVPEGFEVVQPSADNTASYLTGKDGDLQQAAAGAGIASFVLGGLESGNYSNFESASYPPVVNAQCEQEYYKMAFARVVWKAIAWAVEKGVLPEDAMTRCTLTVEAPAVLHRNELEKAQEDQIGVQSGWKDRQTCAAERGLDWHQVSANNQEYQQQQADLMGTMNPLPMPDDEEGGGNPPGQGVRESLERMLRESGFSGTVKDRLGREIHYVNGKRVKTTGKPNKSPTPQKGEGATGGSPQQLAAKVQQRLGGDIAAMKRTSEGKETLKKSAGLAEKVKAKLAAGVQAAVAAADEELGGGLSIIAGGAKSGDKKAILQGTARALNSVFMCVHEEVFEAALSQHSLPGAHAVGMIGAKVAAAAESAMLKGVAWAWAKVSRKVSESLLLEGKELTDADKTLIAQLAKVAAESVRDVLAAAGVEDAEIDQAAAEKRIGELLAGRSVAEGLLLENETDASGHEHGSDGKFTGNGSSSSSGSGASHESPKEQHTPAEKAKAIQQIGDDAISAMQALKKSVADKSMKKQREVMLAEHGKHEEAVNKHFDELEKVVKNDAEANKIAKEMGYQSISGSKEKVLKTLRQKTLDRLGSFIRPYA